MDVARALEGLDPETTLAVVISKVRPTGLLASRCVCPRSLFALADVHHARDHAERPHAARVVHRKGALINAYGRRQSELKLLCFGSQMGEASTANHMVAVTTAVPLATKFGIDKVQWTPRTLCVPVRKVEKADLPPLARSTGQLLRLLGLGRRPLLRYQRRGTPAAHAAVRPSGVLVPRARAR